MTKRRQKQMVAQYGSRDAAASVTDAQFRKSHKKAHSKKGHRGRTPASLKPKQPMPALVH